MKNAIIAVLVVAIIALLAVTFHAPKTTVLPMPTTVGFHQYANPPEKFTGTTFTGIGGTGHPPFAVEETKDAEEFRKELSSIGPIGPPCRSVEGPGFPTKEELSKIIHESTKSKAADQKEAGDW